MNNCYCVLLTAKNGLAPRITANERKIELGTKMDYEILYSFYDSFFNSNSDDSIGKCLIRNYEREFFRDAVAQMSKYIIIDDGESE